ncbi:MAG TPA: glycosyl hydrolase family 18 protein [Jatrophihabitans sp.]
MTARRRLYALLAAGCVVVGSVPVGPARSGAAPVFRSSAWLPYWRMSEATNEVVQNAGTLRTASMFWYDAKSCSSIQGWSGAGDRTVIARLRARHVAVVATVTASGLTPRAAVACFSDPQSRAAHVARLVRLVRSRPYAGLDLDYEHLALTNDARLAARVQWAFSVFVRQLCRRLRVVHKQCIVTVMPRTSDVTPAWRGKLSPGVYDYAALGSAVTRLRVMAYDQHAGAYGPGPIAGYPWVQSIIRYTAGKVPLGKVELGVPTYGRDFARGSSVALAGDEPIALARSHHAAVHWSATQRECTFRYRSGGVTHTVWFSGPHAVAVRTGLARASGMAGAAYWAAGLDMSGTWAAVAGGHASSPAQSGSGGRNDYPRGDAVTNGVGISSST